MTEEKDGPIQFDFMGRKHLLRVFVRVNEGAENEGWAHESEATPGDLEAAGYYPKAVIESRYVNTLNQLRAAESALTTARSEHEAIVRELRGEMERAKAQVESLTGDREELERLRRQVHANQRYCTLGFNHGGECDYDKPSPTRERLAEALANPPGPRHAKLKDSSPSPGVPVAAADSGAAKPRETADTVFAATDNPGDGAGSTSATGEARMVECLHSSVTIDRATGDEWCEDCGALNPGASADEAQGACDRLGIDVPKWASEIKERVERFATPQPAHKAATTDVEYLEMALTPLAADPAQKTAAQTCSHPLCKNQVLKGGWCYDHQPERCSYSAKREELLGQPAQKAEVGQETRCCMIVDCLGESFVCVARYGHRGAHQVDPKDVAAKFGKQADVPKCPQCGMIRSDEMACSSKWHDEQADPAPAAEVPVTRAELISIFRGLATPFIATDLAKLFRWAADELAKRKEG